ncbi:MAG: hypothetical protein HY298_13355 [Verrucomicrobia bacterium]|nr:hypothetical protein [Verrucomicrobiota bacterium]
MSSGQDQVGWWKNLALAGVVLLLMPIWIPLLLFILVVYILFSVFLHLCIWSIWCTRGCNVLFVYSDSPIWQEHIEKQVLPRLGNRAKILNWSERNQWHFPPTLARLAFHHFRGHREFNPLAVVVRPFQRSRKFRFWKPFQDLKHGKPEALEKMEKEFFDSLSVSQQSENT